MFAGRPFPLTNCSIANQTSDSVHIECVEGFDGGLPQTFLMELSFIEDPSKVLRNVTTSRAPPFFESYGLDPGRTYRASLFAVNAKGRSDPFVIEQVAFNGVAKYTGEQAQFNIQLN